MSVWMYNNIADILSKLDDNSVNNVFQKIEFDKEELVNWEEISRKINIVISDDGIIAQYDGYFDLSELDWDYYKNKYGNIHRMDRVLKAERKSPDDYKVAKQADTLMLFYNLSNEKVSEILKGLDYKLPEDYIEKNLEYYLQRTSHGSTLSRVVHAYLAQQLGKEELSWQMFQQALSSDYNDIQGGTTAEGIHTGVMAGTIWIIYAAFAGIDFSKDELTIKPHLPKQWKKLSFALDFKGKNHQIEISHNEVKM
jgi:trehalose/maltose hydrolase-like predicted phosphorylase